MRHSQIRAYFRIPIYYIVITPVSEVKTWFSLTASNNGACKIKFSKFSIFVRGRTFLIVIKKRDTFCKLHLDPTFRSKVIKSPIIFLNDGIKY